MLVVGSLVPAASIALRRVVRASCDRSHAHRIFGDHHRRAHIVPWAHQTNRLRFQRTKRNVQRAAAIGKYPALVDTHREQYRSKRTIRFLEVSHLRPLILATVNVELSHRRTPVRRIDRSRFKIVMVPVGICILLHRHGIVDDVVSNGNVDGAVLEGGIRPPRMINMQHVCRIKAFAQRAHLESRLGSLRRSIDKDRILCRKRIRKVHHARSRVNHVGSIQANKMSRLQRVALDHRGTHRPIKPTAARLVIVGKAHHHRVIPKNHLR